VIAEARADTERAANDELSNARFMKQLKRDKS